MTALANTIVENIRQLKTQDEVNTVIEAIKLQMNHLSRKNIRQFVSGDKVKFTARNGTVVVGTVKKVNQKTVLVSQPNLGMFGTTTYKVPASMLVAA
jgi:formylmethanofuran dehydrogenase subunit D|tara:strand:+ start:397 stop:687 length:291 start_codon:yes stop_codon:yes gene_type:complete